MIELDITRGNNTRTFLGNGQRGFVLGVHDQANPFEVEQNVDNVFLNTVDGGVFVQHAFDTAVDDRATANRRQQDTTQRITEGMAKTAFQRLD